MALAADTTVADVASVRRTEHRAAGVAFGAHALHDGYTDLIYVMLPIWQAEFGLSYAETVRRDHVLFVDAFRSGRIGVAAT